MKENKKQSKILKLKAEEDLNYVNQAEQATNFILAKVTQDHN